MTHSFSTRGLLLCSLCLGARALLAQNETATPNDSVRVSVTLNQDGSRTVYQFDPANHRATATTTAANGKPAGKIQYVLDEAGRFSGGQVFGADGKFLFRTTYKYDAAGRLQEESRFGKDDRPVGKLVYSYDAAGKQTGYSVFDGAGKLIGQTSPVMPEPAPSKPRKAGH
jgi:DNA-binding beta-propeller fold protein YncE